MEATTTATEVADGANNVQCGATVNEPAQTGTLIANYNNNNKRSNLDLDEGASGNDENNNTKSGNNKNNTISNSSQTGQELAGGGGIVDLGIDSEVGSEEKGEEKERFNNNKPTAPVEERGKVVGEQVMRSSRSFESQSTIPLPAAQSYKQPQTASRRSTQSSSLQAEANSRDNEEQKSQNGNCLEDCLLSAREEHHESWCFDIHMIKSANNRTVEIGENESNLQDIIDVITVEQEEEEKEKFAKELEVKCSDTATSGGLLSRVVKRFTLKKNNQSNFKTNLVSGSIGGGGGFAAFRSNKYLSNRKAKFVKTIRNFTNDNFLISKNFEAKQEEENFDLVNVSTTNDNSRPPVSCSHSISCQSNLNNNNNNNNNFHHQESPPASRKRCKKHSKSNKRTYQITKQKSNNSSIKKSLSIDVNMADNNNSSYNVSKNKYVIEDKLKKQHQQQQAGCSSGSSARLDDCRRSTYCSSSIIMGGIDANCDSSFSSMNNCSMAGNNSTVMIHNNSSSNKNSKRRNSQDLEENDQSNDCKDPSTPTSSTYNKVIALIKKKKNSERKYIKKRDNWDRNIEFLLAVIGFAVDLGNIWRFPYVCYKNGGGAFLIPYTIMFILGGLPIFYLEMSLGQYFSSGCLTVWKRVCPMAKGIGYAMCILNIYTGLYYNTIISWAVFFFVESFQQVLPWTSCDNLWNSANCRTIEQRQILKNVMNITQTIAVHFARPTKDYFEREVLKVHLSGGISDLGSIRWPLAIYLAIVFIGIYFAIWKGVKSTGKAVWITALLPYFVLIPLLFRGVFLEGAMLGIKYYLLPQWEKIYDVDVWVEAAKQIFFSLGPGFGTLMALSSYNRFNHNCHRDALIAASVNYFASFISGLVIFAVLGYMATMENVSINDVATEGPGLVFQVYPEGLATMRYSSVWSVLFFLMVITLGIDSTFGGLESVITGLCDEYPRVLGSNRGVFIGLLIILIYSCSLPTTTYGGNYVINLIESYGTTLSLLFIVLIETIIVCWLYGADKFCKNLEEMYGHQPGAYWRICWKYISPTILLLIFFGACAQEFDKYHTLTLNDYTYPSWAPFVGLLMTGSSVCCIPIYAIFYFKTKTSGNFIERLKLCCTPIEEDKSLYRDEDDENRIGENELQLDTVI